MHEVSQFPPQQASSQDKAVSYQQKYGEGVCGSMQIDKLSEALSAAQAEIRSAMKTKINPHLRTKYADLDDCWDAARSPLTKNNLAVTQWTAVVAKTVTVTTVLQHKSGQWMSSSLTMESLDPTPQKVGAVLTYGRRYSFCAAVGLTSDDDDDGQFKGSMASKDAPLPEGLVYTAAEDQRKVLKTYLQGGNLAEVQQKVVNRRAYKQQIPMLELKAFCAAEVRRFEALDQLGEAVDNFSGDPKPILKDNREVIENDWTLGQIENAIDRFKKAYNAGS